MRFYFMRNTYSAQIEALALVGFRFGFTAFGVAFWKPGKKRRTRWMPHLLMSLMAPTGQCDQVWLFRLNVGRWRIGYRTKGDATPDLATYYEAGLRVG